MAPPPTSRFLSALSRAQWRRGVRAGIAVASIMVTFHLLGKPTGWAALGVLLVLNVDNGGPYRSRFGNIITIVIGGSLALLLGKATGTSLALAIVITALFCFAVTLARVISQPLASCSVSILICYIVAYGAGIRTTTASIGYFIIGCLWAAAFSLIFWPVDPFGPARNAVADVYSQITAFAAALPSTTDLAIVNDLIRQIRLLIETAQNSLASTPARMTARTVRARNLAALVQAADLLFARILRISELNVHESPEQAEIARAHVHTLCTWLVSSLAPVEPALRQRPDDDAAAFAIEGSLSVEMLRGAPSFETSIQSDEIDAQFAAVERDCLLSLEVVYESLRAIWTGAEPRSTRAAALRSTFTAPAAEPTSPQIWIDSLRANFTTDSVMFRHALRLGAVAAADVLLLRLIHITHSYWLPMTSIIVLQPYTGETWRKSWDRVGGTLAGAAVAAVLAATIPSDAGIIAAISIGSVFSLAVYAVDYAWYSFFLTPTIVLLTLPALRDWHFAAVRMGMTGLGALTALLAMLLLWPQRESVQLPRLLARAAAADAAYLRAMLKFWQCPRGDIQARTLAERKVLAPARRSCGLASNDAEDSLDRALLEHSIPLRGTAAQDRFNHDALTFTTYIRRLTQSITTLAVIATDFGQFTPAVDSLATRLEAISDTLAKSNPANPRLPEVPLSSRPNPTLADQQLTRIERQVTVLERAATDIFSV
jgi:uncharacterized membrane protein YccC